MAWMIVRVQPAGRALGVRYVVYGVGAVGGVIAGHLHRTGHEVTLVARGAHLTAIRERGLTLDTYEATYTVDAPATETAADVAWTDDTVVVIAVKSQHTPGRPRRPGPARARRRRRSSPLRTASPTRPRHCAGSPGRTASS